MPRLPPRDPSLNRREFLGSSALNAAGMAAGVAGWTGGAFADSPSERVRLGVIGVRNQGKSLATTFAGLPQAEVLALCDVDRSLLPAAVRAVEEVQGRPPRMESDFRRLLDDPQIDAVAIATPDHWHAVMTSLACRAGKDVYLESPATRTLDEGAALLDVARDTGRVVQCGLPQRSGRHFQSAIEHVREGGLGAVHLAKAWAVHQRKSIGTRPDGAAPADVDYDLWLGPARDRPFNANRFHYNWRWFWDYGAGELGNWGVQLLDVARWGLGVDYPQSVAATGGKHHFHDDQQTPDTLHVSYSYPGATITWEHRLWSAHAQEGRSAAVAFYGERGTLIVDRGGWKVYGQRDSASAEPTELLVPHLADFAERVRSRRAPPSELASALVSSDLCHLGNIACRIGRTLPIDPRTGSIQRDPAAQALGVAAPRAPWTLPVV